MKPPKERFVATIPLATTPRDESTLRKRFDAAKSFYNVALGETLKRMRLMRESKAWQAARKLPKGSKGRSAEFKRLSKAFGFEEYALYPFIQEQRRGYVGEHLDAHACQAIAARAFDACQRSLFKGGRPRFKRAGEVRSVEGTGDGSPLRWDAEVWRVVWRGLSLPALIDAENAVIGHAMNHRVVYTRIVRITIKDRERYFAQLVCEGKAYQKPEHVVGSGVVGLDIGPSTIAIATEAGHVEQPKFCEELADRQKEIRRLQRQEDRQRRANNPDAFDAKGRYIKGKRARNRSRRMRRTMQKRAELDRRQAAHRKNLHGRLVNRVLSMGNDVRTEKLSYKSFQRRFGKSVKFRAPGTFVARLRVSAVKVGATVTEFPTYNTKLSQTCPTCGAVKKKELSERAHDCPCGCKGGRDAVSAVLACCVIASQLDPTKAREAWARVCNLSGARSGFSTGTPFVGAPERPSAGVRPGHVPAEGRRRSSRQNARRNPVSAADAVPCERQQGRAAEKPGEGGRQRLPEADGQLLLFGEGGGRDPGRNAGNADPPRPKRRRSKPPP